LPGAPLTDPGGRYSRTGLFNLTRCLSPAGRFASLAPSFSRNWLPATKLVSQNALAASDYFIIPVIPDVMSSRGVTHFRNLVTEKIDKKLAFLKIGAGISDKDTPKSYVPTTKMAGIVPFLAKHAGNAASGLTNIHTEQLKSLRRLWGPDMTTTVVKNYTGVAEAMDAGWPVWTAYETQNIKKSIPMMRSACMEIEARLT